MTKNNDVGYGKPPKASQWKKGQSGNPKGRPKSRPEMLQEAGDILAAPVTARTPDGKTVKLQGFEAHYLALCKEGLKGHVPSLIKAINIMLETQPILEEEANKQENTRQEIIERLHELGINIDENDLPWKT